MKTPRQNGWKPTTKPRCQAHHKNGDPCGKEAQGYFTDADLGSRVNLCRDHARTIQSGGKLSITNHALGA